MTRRRKPPITAAAAVKRARLDSALRAMIKDTPVPDRLKSLVDRLAEEAEPKNAEPDKKNGSD